MALGAAVPIEMAATTALCGDTGLVGAVRIGAGLGFPVALTASEFHPLRILTENGGSHRSTGDLFKFNPVHAFNAGTDFTNIASRKAIRIACGIHLVKKSFAVSS